MRKYETFLDFVDYYFNTFLKINIMLILKIIFENVPYIFSE